MLTHNSTVSKNEPAWSTVDKNRIPRNAHADMGQVADASTWFYPHHWTQDPVIGPSGRYSKGTQFLHSGGLKIALNETRKLDKENHTRAHLLAHAKAINIDEKKAASIMHGTSTKTETVKHTEPVTSSGLNDYSLKGVCEAITACESLETLKGIENTCLLHFSQAEKSGRNWIEKDRAKNESRQVTELVSYRRRAILSKPALEKARQDYQLGQKIGLAK